MIATIQVNKLEFIVQMVVKRIIPSVNTATNLGLD